MVKKSGRAGVLCGTIRPWDDVCQWEWLRRDLKEAARWWQKGAEGGNTLAQSHLGIIYARGWGVPKNYDKAAKWLLLAAERDEEEAQMMLGAMYVLGDGVPRDVIEGYKWLTLSAHKGCYPAAKLLDALKKDLMSAEITAAEELVKSWSPRK